MEERLAGPVQIVTTEMPAVVEGMEVSVVLKGCSQSFFLLDMTTRTGFIERFKAQKIGLKGDIKNQIKSVSFQSR